MNDAFMKEKPILGLVLSMSLPMVLSMLVNSLYNIVDSYFVASISEEAMTALSLVYPIQNLINAITIGFGVGINATIAFYLGAQRKEQADRAASAGFFINAVQSLILMIICLLVMPGFLRLYSKDTGVIDYALRYSRIVFAFAVMISFSLSFEKIFQAVGRMKVSMVSLMAGCISNIILDPLLIFGVGPFPAMGIEGAALATGIGQTVSVAVYLIIYVVRPIPVRITRKALSLEKDVLSRIYSVGSPATLNLAVPSLTISALNAVLAGFSDVYVLVLGVYYKLQTFLYLTANGIVQGIRPLVGYNYGAGEEQRVRKIYRTALTLAAVIMAFGTVICVLFPNQLFGLFTENAATVQMGAEALRIISLGFLVSSVSIISGGVLEGLGLGVPSLIISLLRYLVLLVPAGFILSRFLGAAGVWHGFWLTEWATAAAAFVIYKKTVRKIFSVAK